MPKPRLISPRYWGTWLYVAIVYLITRLPQWAQIGLGRSLGRVLHANHRLHCIARTNVSRCFPDLHEDQVRSLISKYFANQGIDIVESMNIWARNGFRLIDDRLSVEGLEHIREALKQGKGIIFLGSHFSNVDMGAVLIAYIGKKHGLYDFSITYREQKDPVFDWVMKRGRSRYFKRVIPAVDIRTVVRELRGKNIVWFAPDMNVDRKNAIFVPFMGIQASTTTSISRLSKLTDSLVIPWANYRMANRFEYRVKIFPPLANFPSNDVVADTTRVNQFIEQLVIEKPDSYLWILRRFKTRPPGESPFY